MKSIGSFAEDLINEQISNIKSGKEAPPTDSGERPAAPAGKDISNIEVPDDFMKAILGEQYTPTEEPVEVVKEEVQKPIKESVAALITEEKANELISLLQEVRTLLKESCGCGTMSGALGVNLGGPGVNTQVSKKDKGGYISPTRAKRNRKNILKTALRSQK